MASVDTISYAIPAAIAVIGILAGITGYFGKARGETVIALLKEEIDHYIRENGALKEENASLRASDNSKAEQIKTLTTLAQGSPELKRLTAVVNEHAKAASLLTKKVSGLLDREIK